MRSAWNCVDTSCSHVAKLSMCPVLGVRACVLSMFAVRPLLDYWLAAGLQKIAVPSPQPVPGTSDAGAAPGRLRLSSRVSSSSSSSSWQGCSWGLPPPSLPGSFWATPWASYLGAWEQGLGVAWLALSTALP